MVPSLLGDLLAVPIVGTLAGHVFTRRTVLLHSAQAFASRLTSGIVPSFFYYLVTTTNSFQEQLVGPIKFKLRQAFLYGRSGLLLA